VGPEPVPGHLGAPPPGAPDGPHQHGVVVRGCVFRRSGTLKAQTTAFRVGPPAPLAVTPDWS
jgi:hypothetical protein